MFKNTCILCIFYAESKYGFEKHQKCNRKSFWRTLPVRPYIKSSLQFNILRGAPRARVGLTESVADNKSLIAKNRRRAQTAC